MSSRNESQLYCASTFLSFLVRLSTVVRLSDGDLARIPHVAV